MGNTFLSGLLGTLKSTFRINKATLDASGLSAVRTLTLQDLAGTVALSERPFPVLTVTPSANQNDYNPTGLSAAGILRANIGTTMKLTGLATGADGRPLVLQNVSTDYLLWLEHESASSSAANRFTLPNAFPAFLMPGDTMTLLYDGTSSRWRVWIWPNQGIAMGLRHFDDFMGSSTTQSAGTVGTVGLFGATTNGTAATIQSSSYLIDTTEKPAGVIQADTGTTATGRSVIGNTGTGDIVPTLGASLSVARLAVETTVDGTQTFQVVSGFMDCAGGTLTDGVAWVNRWNGSAAEWSQDTYSGGARNGSVANSPSSSNTYIWLVVFINPGWTRSDFIYSTDSLAFTLANSPGSGLPGSGAPTTWCGAGIIKSAGATSRAISVDLAGYRVDYARG